MRLKKCHFMRTRVDILGHYLDKDGIYVYKVKVEKIPNATRKELRSFLGLASYYRLFINYFEKIAGPLTEKISENI